MLACAGLGKLERAFAIAQDAAARDLPVGRVAHAALLQLLCSHGNLQVRWCLCDRGGPIGFDLWAAMHMGRCCAYAASGACR